MATIEKEKALDVVRQMVADGQISQDVAEKYFPELKKSRDERIRKELLDFCKSRAEKYPNDPKYKNISAWIAWLEKQGGQNPADVRTTGYWHVEDIEQKSAWSEVDETVLNNLIYALANDRIGNNRDEYVEWLKFLKDRVSPQPKQEWSEEDEIRMNNICHFLGDYGDQYYGHLTLQGTIKWLKSLKQRIGG